MTTIRQFLINPLTLNNFSPVLHVCILPRTSITTAVKDRIGRRKRSFTVVYSVQYDHIRLYFVVLPDTRFTTVYRRVVYEEKRSYAIVFHPIASYSILLHRIPSYRTVFHPIASYCTVFHPNASYSIVLHRILPPYTIVGDRPG